jgi:hypothetical protein
VSGPPRNLQLPRASFGAFRASTHRIIPN